MLFEDPSGPIGYLLYLPEDYASRPEPWPLILFLHGAGERGGDLSLVKLEGLPKMLERLRRFPFVVVSPQTREKRWAVEPVARLLEHVSATRRIDRARVYATGLSSGAAAALRLAIRLPDGIAAVAPIAPDEEPEDLCRIRRVAAWFFHNARDGRVPVRRTRRLARALEGCGAEVRLTVYPRDGHDAWSEAYATPALYDWLLAHESAGRLESPADHAPRSP